MDLGEDWSNNEIIQAVAIGEFTNLDGIEWRNGAETAADEVKFDDVLWKRIFSETSQFLKDSHFGKEDINIDIDTGTRCCRRKISNVSWTSDGYAAAAETDGCGADPYSLLFTDIE